MDRRPEATRDREQLLRVPQAKYTLRPVVPPVALERKVISMLNPSKDTQQTAATTTTDMTSSTTTTTAPSSSPTSATTTPKVVRVTPPVSTTTTKQTPTASTAPSFVGGKRPLGEESTIVIRIDHQGDDDKRETSSDVPVSELSKNQPVKEQEQHGQRKPEETTKKLSTEETSSQRGRDLDRKREKAKLGVQFSDVSPKRDVSHVMQFFQEQEKNLQENFLSLPKKSQKKPRSPSPKMQQAAGLEHLDNLIRLMEQLTSLKDENCKLRKRCDYLESTKILLQAKRDLSLEASSSSSGFLTLPPKHRQQPHPPDQADTLTSGQDLLQARAGLIRLARPRISSAEELDYLEIADSSSDQTPKKQKSAMHKRSFSTGSLEVPSEMTSEVGGVEARKRMKGKSGRSIFGKSSGSKQKSKSSKWSRVKKVLTGQKLYEDLGTTIRTIRDLGKSSHVRYSAPGPHDYGPATPRISPGETRPAVSVTSAGQQVYRVPPLVAEPAYLTESVLHQYQEPEDADLTSDIWMGPPDWWQEYEARKESGGTSTNSEVSSVIEVTTMYLGSKKETTTSAAAPATTTAPSPTTLMTTSPEKYLTIEKPLPRRQSSPSLVMKEAAEEEDTLQELTTSVESSRILHKSSSCKSADLDIHNLGEGRQAKKSHRSAWGRVKDIIHTRKDSIQKKPKRVKSGLDSEETSEIDVEVLIEESWRSDVFEEGLVGRSTPKSSPMVIRQQSTKGLGDVSPGASVVFSKTSPSRGSSYHAGSSPGNVDVAALLAGSVSDEFNKKMMEWEKMKSKKSSSFRASVDESDISSSLEVTGELPARSTETRELKVKVSDSMSGGITPEESNTSMELLGAPNINLDEIQRRMTDSFSRKMQDWERLKYKGISGAVREPSPESDRKESKGRKEDRQKSKRSREEKEKEKWERQREREMQKVEREQVKLEKEKMRIEKERLRTLEREAKLEKLKGRLSQVEVEGGFKNPVLSPLAEYKVTADFARKLHEWELKKGLSHDVSNSIYLEAQKIGMQHLRRGGRLQSLSKQEETKYGTEDTYGAEGSRPGGNIKAAGSKKASPPPPLTLQPYWDSPEESPVERYSEPSVGEGDDETCTSVTEECLTKSNITSLERANTQLLENLQKKEMEYAAVQDEVHKMNEKLARVRENHAAEMARFHRELAVGNLSGPLKLEVGELETTVGDLEAKIKMMENFGEKMASSMESAAIGKWQSIEGEETVHTELVELVDQMRGMLVQASMSEEHSQKTMALSNFETLYTQAMKLQVQMNNLRLSHLERNREIMIIKRQLLLQEVNNLLLQADITRRETELYQFNEAKRFASLKRWNTFSGTGRHRPQAQVELPSSSRDARLRHTETPRIHIPHIQDELILASAASSSISPHASPLSIAAAGDSSLITSSSTAGQMLPSPGAAHEQFTDHLDTHVLLTPSLGRRDHLTSTPARTSPGDQRARDSTTPGGGHEPITWLQLPRLAIHIPPRKHPPDQPPASVSPLGPLTESSPSISGASPSPAKREDEEQQPPPTASNLTEDFGSKKGPSTKPKFTTICDSAPLHNEIRELRREKRKVEKGPPTLKRSESEGLSAAPSPGKVPRQTSYTEAPTQFIPKQPSMEKPKLTKAAPIIDDDYSPEPSVMECTETVTVLEQTDSKPGAVGGTSPQSQAALTTRRDSDPTSDQCMTGSTSPRSSVSCKHRTRVPREEREAKLKDYGAISPKGSPVAARGKPPLPRHATPLKQSPSASSATEKGPRSKSVSDMEDKVPVSSIDKPLQEAMNRFEKRATVCESEDRPIELRKTPSPTLHLPRVGLVSRVRRLKPAAELLEESQRYRSGHSIYATRILQRYLPRDDNRQDPGTSNSKESQSGFKGQASPVPGAGSPKVSSDFLLKQTDIPQTQNTTRAQDITNKLSSPSEPNTQEMPSPFSDVTNGGQAQTVNGHPQSRPQERTLSDSDIDRQPARSSLSALKSQQRKSCEVALVLSSSAAPSSEASFQMVWSQSSEGDSSPKPGSFANPVSCQSLPTITHPDTASAAASEIESARGRAATYCVSEVDKSKTSPSIQPSSRAQSQESANEKALRTKEKTSKSSNEKESSGRLPSSMSPDRRGAGRGKMRTVGVLCKQSLSFDLGVSLYSQNPSSEESIPKARQARSWDPSETTQAQASSAIPSTLAPTSGATSSPTSGATSSSPSAATSAPPSAQAAAATGDVRPASTSSEGEVAPSSPTSTEKKRSRRFLDSSWLQKSKKFFKVSK